jgi:hypothetical protein
VVDDAKESLDVVVCCATERVELALYTFPGLVAERLLPRLVGGIEAGVAPLTDAIARASGPTLFVLCVGSSLGGARTRQLVEAFTARRGPLHRLLVLEVDHDDAAALSASIVLSAQDVRRRMAPRGSGPASIRRSGGATVAAGVVTNVAAGKDPTVPRPRVVVSDRLPNTEHVFAPATQRSRPVLRLVPDPPAEPPADPAAPTAEIPLASVADALAPAVAATKPRKATPWITAAAVVGTIAAVMAFRPESGVPTQLTAGLAEAPDGALHISDDRSGRNSRVGTGG